MTKPADLWHPHRRQPASTAPESPQDREDPVRRQYRYLLRTAPADALEAAHDDALQQMSHAAREALLRTVRAVLLVGDHLVSTDHAQLAHLITSGERRSPGQLLQALPSTVADELAAGVLESEASFGLLGGYASWDGAEPAPPEDTAWADGGFEKRRGQVDPRNDPRGGFGFGAGAGGGG